MIGQGGLAAGPDLTNMAMMGRLGQIEPAEAQKRWEAEQAREAQFQRHQAVQLAISARSENESADAIVKAAAVFYKFISEGPVG